MFLEVNTETNSIAGVIDIIDQLHGMDPAQTSWHFVYLYQKPRNLSYLFMYFYKGGILRYLVTVPTKDDCK